MMQLFWPFLCLTKGYMPIYCRIGMDMGNISLTILNLTSEVAGDMRNKAQWRM